MDGLRWGLIGASDIAATRILPALRAVGHQAVSVYSSSLQRGRAYAQAQGIASAAGELGELLARDDVDAVYVSTTNELHHAQTVAAAAAGKHVLCEKPLAMSLDEAWEMVGACERAGVVLATNHHLPASGFNRAMAQLVARGDIGEPRAMRVFHAGELPERLAGWRLTSPERGGGVILDITSHDASIVYAVLGREALLATAVAARQGGWGARAEDAAMSAITYEGGVIVQTHDAFTIPFAGTGVEVHGSEGSIVARDVMSQDPIGSLRLRTAEGEREVEPLDRRDLYQVTLEVFAAATRGEGQPIVDGVGGVRTLAVALAVREAAETARAVEVVWRREARATG